MTISVGIMTHNPEEMVEQIRETVGNEIWSDEAFAKAGNMVTFLLNPSRVTLS